MSHLHTSSFVRFLQGIFKAEGFLTIVPSALQAKERLQLLFGTFIRFAMPGIGTSVFLYTPSLFFILSYDSSP